MPGDPSGSPGINWRAASTRFVPAWRRQRQAGVFVDVGCQRSPAATVQNRCPGRPQRQDERVAPREARMPADRHLVFPDHASERLTHYQTPVTTALATKHLASRTRM